MKLPDGSVSIAEIWPMGIQYDGRVNQFGGAKFKNLKIATDAGRRDIIRIEVLQAIVFFAGN